MATRLIILFVFIMAACTPQEPSLQELNTKYKSLLIEKNYNEAKKIGEQALAVAHKQYGKNSQQTGTILYNLGELSYIHLKDYDGAITYFNEAKGIKIKGAKQLQVAAIKHYLGLIALDKGNYSSETELSLKEALHIFEVYVQNERGIDTLNALHYSDAHFTLGRYYQGKGIYDSSAAYYTKAIRVYENLKIFEPQILTMYTELVAAYRSLGDIEKADRLAHRLSRMAYKYGDDIAYADALYALGTIKREEGKFDSSAFYFNEAFELYKKHNLYWKEADIYYSRAVEKSAQGSYLEADSLLQLALPLYQKHWGIQSTENYNTIVFIGRNAMALKQYGKAKQALEIASDLALALFGPHHKDKKAIELLINECEAKTGS